MLRDLHRTDDELEVAWHGGSGRLVDWAGPPVLPNYAHLINHRHQWTRRLQGRPSRRDVLTHLTGDWQTTADLAKRAGIKRETAASLLHGLCVEGVAVREVRVTTGRAKAWYRLA